MPVQGSSSLVSNAETEKRKEDLLMRIKIAASNAPPVIVHDDSSSDDEQEEQLKEAALQAYKRIIDQTMDLPLEKLILTAEGCDIFDELCLRLDVNQKYAELLPQWKDVAHHLQMDDLTTKWVEVCVRPREGLTRAMLEVYMKDGGTLGEVLEALLHLECLQILEETKPKLEKYLKKRDAGEIVPKVTNNFVSNEHFFSVLKTLMMALGNKDPCQDLHKMANGLKKSVCSSLQQPIMKMNLDGMTLEHSILVQAGSEALNNNSESLKDWPTYRSELHLNKLSKLEDKKFHDNDFFNSNNEKKAEPKLVCRVMLLFSEDGVQASEAAIELAKRIEHEVVLVAK